MSEKAIQQVMDAYKHRQADLARDLSVNRSNVCRWISSGLVPACEILPLVQVAIKRDKKNERKTLPDELTLIKRLLRDHVRTPVSKRGNN